MLSFLQTNDVTTTFNNAVSNRVPFLIRVYATDIPIENLPRSSIHGNRIEKKNTRAT